MGIRPFLCFKSVYIYMHYTVQCNRTITTNIWYKVMHCTALHCAMQAMQLKSTTKQCARQGQPRYRKEGTGAQKRT